MKRVQTAIAVVIVVLVLICVAAIAIRPLVPWLVAVFFLASILRLAMRDK